VIHTRRSIVPVLTMAALLVAGLPGSRGAHAGPAGSPGHAHDHEHPPVPPAYAKAEAPPPTWTDPETLARGKAVYAARCALCHGERGDGKGPAAVGLALKPADVTDAKMVAEMSGAYWLWRVSEGGQVEPFKSKGSAMPAWKHELSLPDRWAVIGYMHTLSGHSGPHTAAEHPELGPKPKLVTGEGTVIALRPQRQQLVVEHGEIKGFMEPMTMGYKTHPAALLKTVQPGDKVRFTIDTEARAITKIEKLKP
jgi:mono/diheme cytochrome c family protein